MEAPQGDRSHLPGLAAAALASAALAACGGGGGGGSSGNPSNPSSAYAYSAPQTEDDAARFLLQAQFHASRADIAAVTSAGYAAWLQAQITSTNSLSGWDWLKSVAIYDNVGATGPYYYFSTGPGDNMIWNQLITAPDGPRRRMALALSEIFVVSMNPMTGYWPCYVTAGYWDILCANAFGNYRTLLEAITLNLAMGNFLNTRGNKKADGNGSAPDENYAREVMQLFSIGLVQLNMDGTPVLNGGATVDTYSNTDVSQLAQVFTGYDYDSGADIPFASVLNGGSTNSVPQTTGSRLPMIQRSSGFYHSPEEVNFLGAKIDKNTSPSVALTKALDTLFNHANTAPFISKQLIQRLITSNPTPAYVQRVAQVFANNGRGVRGDLAAVFTAILQDDEARAPSGVVSLQFGKLREPMLRLVQWARTFNATSKSGHYDIGDTSDAASKLGQSPLRSPTVFNFFRPGYVPSSTTPANMVAPEFQLVNEVSVAGYLNYMQGTAISATYNPSATPPVNTGGDLFADYANTNNNLIALAESPSAAVPSKLVDEINLLLAARQLSSATTSLITQTVGAMAGTVIGNTTTTASNLRNRVYAAVLMVMASPEYLIQK